MSSFSIRREIFVDESFAAIRYCLLKFVLKISKILKIRVIILEKLKNKERKVLSRNFKVIKKQGVRYRQRLLTQLSLGAFALWAGGMVGSTGLYPVEQAHAESTGAIKPTEPLHRIPDFVALVHRVKPAVVSITSMIRPDVAMSENGGILGGGGMGENMPFPFPFPFPFQMMPQTNSQPVEIRGSGFLISSDGYVVTNNHMVKGATKVMVTLDDGSTLQAKIVGRDSKTDLALLKLKTSRHLPFIELGESKDVQPGEWVIAVGNPYGLGGTVTAGIVSARGRDINEGPYDNFIQVDAPINRGNSGGPLFTQDGKVIGVNTVILSSSGGGSIGIGFAIPSDTVRSVVDQLRRTGHVVRGYLGVSAQTISPVMARALSLPTPPGSVQGEAPAGALIASVSAGSPAERAGLKTGDVIIDVNGQKITTPHDLAIDIAAIAPGTEVPLKYVRSGKIQTTEVHIGKLGNSSANNGGWKNTKAGSDIRLGVNFSALTPDVRQQLGIGSNVQGVVVQSITPGSLADQAGIHVGDIIQSVGNQKVENPHAALAAMKSAIAARRPVLFRILRQGQSLFIAIAVDASGNNNANNMADNNNDDD